MRCNRPRFGWQHRLQAIKCIECLARGQPVRVDRFQRPAHRVGGRRFGGFTDAMFSTIYTMSLAAVIEEAVAGE